MTSTTCMDTTTSRLLAAVDRINDEYVLEAERKVHVKSAGWIKWAVAAACLVVAALIILPRLNRMSPAGFTTEDRMHSTYEEFSSIYSDDVFDAFVSSAIAQEYNLSFKTLWLTNTEGESELETACIVLNNPDDFDEWAPESPEGQTIHIARHCKTLLAVSDNEYFKDADDLGIREDYQVDGTEVQKFYRRDYEIRIAEQLVVKYPDEPGYLEDLEVAKTSDVFDIYWERVSVNNEWYYVFARDEYAADSVAETLATMNSRHL